MDLINKTYYINLDHRKDRKEHLTKEFQRIGFDNFERFPAVHCNFGALGCGLSHLSILKKFLEDPEIEIGMIIEDDAQFLVDREKIDEYIKNFKEDPDSDILCLGFGSYDQVPYNSQFHRSLNLQTTSCYVVKKKFIPILIENISESCQLLSKSFNMENSIDIYWKKLQKNYIFLIPKEKVVKQYPSYSDIIKRYVSYQ